VREGEGEILSGEMRNVVVTRVEHSGPPRRSRNLEERFLVRFPSLLRRGAPILSRLSPRSRLRRAFLRRALVSGWAAVSRRDFELRRVFFAPDVESELPPGAQTLGLSGMFRGHAAMEQALSEFADSWSSWELEPAYILDLGDRLLCLGSFRGRGQASDVKLEQEYAQLVTLREGLVTRDEGWLRWEEGLRAAGLDPDAIALPKGGKEGHVASGSYR
jgi:ketosteroid isomerase-like protein